MPLDLTRDATREHTHEWVYTYMSAGHHYKHDPCFPVAPLTLRMTRTNLLLGLQDMMEVKSKMLMTFVASLWMAKITHSNHH